MQKLFILSQILLTSLWLLYKENKSFPFQIRSLAKYSWRLLRPSTFIISLRVIFAMCHWLLQGLVMYHCLLQEKNAVGDCYDFQNPFVMYRWLLQGKNATSITSLWILLVMYGWLLQGKHGRL